MSKYICEGTIIRHKIDLAREGRVCAIDRKNKIVIAQQGNSYWSDKIKDIDVISYKEVQ